MRTYIFKRLLHALFVIFAAILAIFLILHLSGDPAQMMVDIDAGPEEVEAVRKKMGFDRPIYIQIGRFFTQVVQGDLGESLRYSRPALPLVLERLPATIELTMVAMVISILFAVPAGVISATKRNSALDHFVMTMSLLGQTVPVFWLGLMLVLVFSVELRWFPAFGRGGVNHLILPAITLAAFSTARIARLVRSQMLDELSKDYINTARAKGLSERIVVYLHALKNASSLAVTVIGLQMGHLLGGAVITETIFAWPGLGRLLVQSIHNRDYPVIQAAVLVIAVTFVFINLIVDIMYTYLDPRIRYESS